MKSIFFCMENQAPSRLVNYRKCDGSCENLTNGLAQRYHEHDAGKTKRNGTAQR